MPVPPATSKTNWPLEFSPAPSPVFTVFEYVHYVPSTVTLDPLAWASFSKLNSLAL